MQLAHQLEEALSDLKAGDHVRYRDKAGWRTLKPGQPDWVTGVLRERGGSLRFFKLKKQGSKIVLDPTPIDVTGESSALMTKISKAEAEAGAEQAYLRIGGLGGM